LNSVDFLPKTFLILYPCLENSTTGNAILRANLTSLFFRANYHEQSGAGKGGFFQKVPFVFQIFKSPKKIFQITILNLKCEIPANKSKQLNQISSSG
jgi:hypothetical protein